jgi:hypothetical protein
VKQRMDVVEASWVEAVDFVADGWEKNRSHF